MACLLKISIVFYLVITSLFACYVCGKEGTKIAIPIYDISRLCSDNFIFSSRRKLICLLCKGLDPDCFGHSTSTTTSTTSSTTISTTTPSTTTSSSTTSSTTTPTTTTPTTTTAEKADNE